MQQSDLQFLNAPMTGKEYRAAITLGSIFALRLLGLFMVLPVFALYIQDLPGATPNMIGMAMGIYGLTQALFQIPFGLLSDYIDRKKVILAGLIIFIIGSIVAAEATNITALIVGRALQGSGAVGSVLIALLADLTREEHRSKAMAILGCIIGFSFTLAMAIGPILNQFIGVSGLFWTSLGFGCLCILLLYTAVPHPTAQHFHRDTEVEPAQFKQILFQPDLMILNFGIFILHMMLTASFTVIPFLLKTAGLPENQQGYVYLPILLCAFVAMLPLMLITEKKQLFKPAILGSIGVIMLSMLSLWIYHDTVLAIAIDLFFFFTTFTLLEAFLPALISRCAPVGRKGTAIGLYSCCQFFGIFIGGLVGGKLYGLHYPGVVFLVCAISSGLWLIFAKKMRAPSHTATRMLNLGILTDAQAQRYTERLRQIPGVLEAQVMADDGIAYVKIDLKICKEEYLNYFYMDAINEKDSGNGCDKPSENR